MCGGDRERERERGDALWLGRTALSRRTIKRIMKMRATSSDEWGAMNRRDTDGKLCHSSHYGAHSSSAVAHAHKAELSGSRFFPEDFRGTREIDTETSVSG